MIAFLPRGGPYAVVRRGSRCLTNRFNFWLSFPKILSTRIRAMRRIRASCDAMLAILHLFGTSVANLFKSRRRLEVENLFLRHQLNIALRCASHRLQVRGSD